MITLAKMIGFWCAVFLPWFWPFQFISSFQQHHFWAPIHLWTLSGNHWLGTLDVKILSSWAPIITLSCFGPVLCFKNHCGVFLGPSIIKIQFYLMKEKRSNTSISQWSTMVFVFTLPPFYFILISWSELWYGWITNRTKGCWISYSLFILFKLVSS